MNGMQGDLSKFPGNRIAAEHLDVYTAIIYAGQSSLAHSFHRVSHRHHSASKNESDGNVQFVNEKGGPENDVSMRGSLPHPQDSLMSRSL